MATSSEPIATTAESPSVDVFITAPRGTADMQPLLAALSGQLGPADRIVILDGTTPETVLDASAVPGIGSLEHVRHAGESAFHLRAQVAGMACRDIIVLLEEHAIPSSGFISEVRRMIAANPAVAAVKLLGRNDTSASPWGWANFFMAFGECLHPSPAAPKAMLSTSAAIRRAALEGATCRLGDWETRVLPGLNGRPQALAYSNNVWIDHVEHCDMIDALIGNFRNQRSMAALRVAQGHRRGKLMVRAFKDLAIRSPGRIARALAGREEYRYFHANRVKVAAVCWAAALGAMAGACFGAGGSMRKMH